jgi:N-acetylmuramoyl-L-alanine amidase
MKFAKTFFAFFLHKGFARVSPVFLTATLALVSTPASPRTASTNNSDPTATVKREAAEAQFTKAEEQRAALNNKPPERRTLAEYKSVVASYKRVYLITPHAADVQDSLLAVGELYTEMGDRFGRTYYQSAVDSYQFLLREYPKSRFTQDVLLRVAKLQQEKLGDTAAAMKTYQDLLKRFPRSEHKREAQESLAELALLQNSGAAETKTTTSARTPVQEKQGPLRAAQNESNNEDDADERTSSRSDEIPTVKTISAVSSGDSTRITIALKDQVQYMYARIENPNRIYFDFHTAKISTQLKRNGVKVSGSLVSNVRVAQNSSGVVRIVMDINGVKDYTASLLGKPSRLVIDLYANPQTLKAAAPVSPENANLGAAETINVASKSPEPSAPVETKNSSAKTDTLTIEPAIAKGKGARGKPAKSASGKPDLIKPPSVPTATRDGQATLTRVLGLKIGRIVIDAGHGGHDTGTIGPTGLMEKDLCLDVALRLGKIIQQKLPGADVVYTRPDDTFIPLEERTRIANEAKADLFISIHANSSHDSQARGIETYYLNLKGSAEAMEVAARENASSSDGIHDLEDIVKRIARTEKIDESKEFAQDVQESLSRNVGKTNRLIKNRGVRKAPFVVLIGADMPSILTEISFLSNPSDEQALKKPEQRQRVAEGIYQGVAGYLQSLNSMTLNLQPVSAPKRPALVSTVEESRNQK